MLPLILRRAVILVVTGIIAVGMTAFCAGRYGRSKDPEASGPMRIGYAAEENMLTALAVAYVEQMESVKALCTLEKVTQEEGKALLAEGTLAALVVLPENIVDEILQGSNAPATLYLPDGARTSVTAGRIFEEFANAAIGMLQTAQAEIYAAQELCTRLYTAMPQEDDGRLQEMYDDINRFNLRMFANRESLFGRVKLSLTENNSYAVYYAGAALTLYMLVSGLLIGPLCKRSRLWQRIAERTLGISYFGQLWCRILGMLPLLALIAALPFGALLCPPLAARLSVVFCAELAAAVLILLLFTACYLQLVYQLVEEAQRAVLVLGILALFQGYMAGCIIPAVLLPQGIAVIGGKLPAAYLRRLFTMLFTGGTQGVWGAVGGLAVWSVLCFALAWGTMRFMENDGTADADKKAAKVSFSNPLTNTLPWILFKRLLRQRSMWACLGAVVLLSAAVAGIERRTDTVIDAAVYDTAGDFEEALLAYDGLVRFAVCDSEEAVRQMVLRDKAECGYILPEGLAEKLTDGSFERAVTVYEDGDAVVSRLVDEVLFNILFQPSSLQWFEDYMAQREELQPFLRDGGARTAVERQLAADTTFSFRIERLGTTEKPKPEQTAFPKSLAVAVSVILCGIQGAVQAVLDIRGNRFYKRSHIAVFMTTVAEPMLLGAAAGALILWLPL